MENQVISDLKNAVTAVESALSDAQNSPAVDPTWTAVQEALTSNGWNPPVPATVPDTSGDETETSTDASA